QIELIGIQSRVLDYLAELETERQGRMIRTIDDPLGTEGANDVGRDVGITIGSRVNIQIILVEHGGDRFLMTLEACRTGGEEISFRRFAGPICVIRRFAAQ